MTDAERDQVLELAALAVKRGGRAELRLPWPPAGSVADLVVTESGRVTAYVTFAVAKAGPVPMGDDTGSQTVAERRLVADGKLLEGASEEEWAVVVGAVGELRAQLDSPDR